MMKPWITAAAVLVLSFAVALSSAYCQEPISGVEAFVHAIYKPYSTNSAYSSIGPGLQKIYSPKVVSLIRADTKRTPKGDVGTLDFDPLCQCQDADGLKLVSVDVNQTQGDTTNATVNLQFSQSSAKMIKVNLRLVHLPKGWRVDDVACEHNPSLQTLLTREKY